MGNMSIMCAMGIAHDVILNNMFALAVGDRKQYYENGTWALACKTKSLLLAYEYFPQCSH
jgi:hypothetical protein